MCKTNAAVSDTHQEQNPSTAAAVVTCYHLPTPGSGTHLTLRSRHALSARLRSTGACRVQQCGRRTLLRRHAFQQVPSILVWMISDMVQACCNMSASTDAIESAPNAQKLGPHAGRNLYMKPATYTIVCLQKTKLRFYASTSRYQTPCLTASVALAQAALLVVHHVTRLSQHDDNAIQTSFRTMHRNHSEPLLTIDAAEADNHPLPASKLAETCVVVP